jgi:hypothetical protein
MPNCSQAWTSRSSILRSRSGRRRPRAARDQGHCRSGVFGLPGLTAELLGAASLLAYLIVAGLMLLVGFCFAEVGSRVSAAGYMDMRTPPLDRLLWESPAHSCHPLAGFLVGGAYSLEINQDPIGSGPLSHLPTHTQATRGSVWRARRADHSSQILLVEGRDYPRDPPAHCHLVTRSAP